VGEEMVVERRERVMVGRREVKRGAWLKLG